MILYIHVNKNIEKSCIHWSVFGYFGKGSVYMKGIESKSIYIKFVR